MVKITYIFKENNKYYKDFSEEIEFDEDIDLEMACKKPRGIGWYLNAYGPLINIGLGGIFVEGVGTRWEILNRYPEKVISVVEVVEVDVKEKLHDNIYVLMIKKF